MTLLLFRLYELRRLVTQESGELERVDTIERRLLGEVADVEAAKARIEIEVGIEAEPLRTQAPEYTVPLNRFAVYEPTDDADGDGFPDGFRFLDIYTATPPKPEPVKVRKGTRRK